MVLSYLRAWAAVPRTMCFGNVIWMRFCGRRSASTPPSSFAGKSAWCKEPVECRILTDEKWLLFIVEQILSNCVKYAAGGTVTISVTERQVLRIADTGIGIAPEDLPRVFEKGFTGYNGRADKSPRASACICAGWRPGGWGTASGRSPSRGRDGCLPGSLPEPLETE